MKILVVDDDKSILDLLVAVLESQEYENVDFAMSGEEALEKIQAASIPYECFLFDIQMPGMDGTELCRRVRQVPDYAETPIIMLTAMTEKKYFDMAFTAGATDYVTKPFDVTELTQRVKFAGRYRSESHRSDATGQTTGDSRKTIFEDPITVNGIEGVIGKRAQHNYVKQMLTTRNQPVEAIAIRIPELEEIFQGTDIEEFTYVIMDIAEVITDIVRGNNIFTSYIGSGIFICISPDSENLTRETVLADLIRMLNDTSLVYCEEIKTALTAQVGYYCRRDAFGKTGPKGLFGAAIDRLDSPEIDSADETVLSNVCVNDFN